MENEHRKRTKRAHLLETFILVVLMYFVSSAHIRKIKKRESATKRHRHQISERVEEKKKKRGKGREHQTRKSE